MKLQDFEKIALGNGLIKMRISQFPTYIEPKNKLEGLEFKGGLVTSFWIKEGNRVYGEPASDHISKILEIMKGTQEKQEEKKENHKNVSEEKEDKKEKVEESNTLALLPECLTPALLTKWGSMNTMDRILMFQKTPKDKICQIEVGTVNGKKEYAPYVEGNYMIKEANASFLFDWYIVIADISTGEKGVSVRGTLYAWFKEYNKYLSRPATGYQKLNAKVDVQLAIKGATTDAIKKGLSLFGFNSDVYSGDI